MHESAVQPQPVCVVLTTLTRNARNLDSRSKVNEALVEGTDGGRLSGFLDTDNLCVECMKVKKNFHIFITKSINPDSYVIGNYAIDSFMEEVRSELQGMDFPLVSTYRVYTVTPHCFSLAFSHYMLFDNF